MPRICISETLERLPDCLSERTRVLGKGRQDPGQADEISVVDGSFVLYWLRTAIRTDENPALDVAAAIGNRLGLPVLVYHGLSERYPYASDRHHTFVLQAARDQQRALKHHPAGDLFHLERPDCREPVLRDLAQRAACVVTEEMPVQPLRRWTTALDHRIDAPLVAVDTACVVPMRLVGAAYERAFAYRDATGELYAERLSRAPQPAILPEFEFPAAELPSFALDLESADLETLVAQCRIDHSIGPVADTVGGSEAGYERWEAFKQRGLARYGRLRNNPLAEGVSRMSAYLHYGMVSPMRIAREAARDGSDGAKKFLDELLIWRELAYSFCFHRHDHDRTTALPRWALRTLEDHEADPRPALWSWERMARAQTGDALWDVAQQSLLVCGELHNNVRMTWGKGVLNWTSNAADSLRMLIDLNHRYALDGRDPASFGGILWCLGQFDRPFKPPRPILGTVRGRSTDQHARRIDVNAYRRLVTRSSLDDDLRIAVVGAGMSGLICARTLADHGHRVSILEKSRGVGGRMATRRSASGTRFDHGAQYLTVRDPRFRRYVRSWVQEGVVARWPGRIVCLERGQVTAPDSGCRRFVATPGMNALGKHLSQGLDVRLDTRIRPIQRQAGRWRIEDEDGIELGDFDVVLVTAPAEQTAELLRHLPPLANRAAAARMRGCWALMVEFDEPLEVAFDAAFVGGSPLAWIARETSKPQRLEQPDRWVLHATAEWSDPRIGWSTEAVTEPLLAAFWAALDQPPQAISLAASHRWRYASVDSPLEESCLFDPESMVGACGDWFGGPRIEEAFLSGMAMAGRLLGHLANRPLPSRRSAHQMEMF